MATQAQIDELLAKMAEERATLLAVARALDEPRAELRPPEGDGEDGWSAKEQLAHMAAMEASYRSWVQRAVEEDRPDLTGTESRDPARISAEGAHAASVAEHLEELDRQRALTLAYLETLPAPAYDRTAVSPIFGELSVLQWLRSYYRHDRMHAAQIEGRKSDYAPRFLGGEPDQRTRR
jgi:hypothetical protein